MTGKITNLDEIRAHIPLNIESLLAGLGVTNIKVGSKEIRANCPIDNHRKSPQSFSIDHSTARWFCHACTEGGDIFDLYKKLKNIELPDAFKEVANTLGIEVKYEGAIKTNLPRAEYKRTPQQVLDQASPSGTHEYLKAKCVKPCDGLYFGKDDRDNDAVVVPLRNINNELQTVQFVHGYAKPFLRYNNKGGIFFHDTI